MGDLPITVEELEDELIALDAELTRALTIIDHLKVEPRQETLDRLVSRTLQLEALLARIRSGLPLN
ncbi:hypothetical protein [Enterovirga aerilata]|uniref:Uncharacterized protein n=1 Tax=Enterovirga aerilata TaxID=2730920 RepID=A0A849IB64_9HYPH|nr:hypothetical protein [Enterovirga sp. DB1703]NNM71183.1 hypothetical protein [Enterovirga sp. DB1703]